MPEPTTTKLQEWEKILSNINSNAMQLTWHPLSYTQHKFMKSTYMTDDFEDIADKINYNIINCRRQMIRNLSRMQMDPSTTVCERFILTLNICNCTLDLMKMNEITHDYGEQSITMMAIELISMMDLMKQEYLEALNDVNSHVMILDQEPFNIAYDVATKYLRDDLHSHYSRPFVEDVDNLNNVD